MKRSLFSLLLAVAAAMTIGGVGAPAAAQDAQADAWARVNGCQTLADFRRAYPNSRYASRFARIRQANGRPCGTPPPPPPPDPDPLRPVTCDTRWADAARRNTASAYESFAERCSSHRNWSEALNRSRRLRTPPPPPVETAAQLEYQASVARGRNDFVSAREFLRRACYTNNPSPLACNNYAFELTSERSGRVDYPGARLNYARGCNLLAEAQRCDNAWITAISTTYGPAQPAAEVLELHRKSGRGANMDCNGWRAEHCYALAILYDNRNILSDRPMVRLLFETACRGNASACWSAAIAHALDYQVPGSASSYDFGAVRYFFDRAPTGTRFPGASGVDCNRLPFPCFVIAYGLSNPVRYGTTTFSSFDYPRAASFAQASCTAGELRACNLYGKLILDARVFATPATAFGHFQTACRIGRLADACNNRGLAYERGFGVQRSATYAVLDFQTACTYSTAPDWPGGPSNGRAQGCYNLGRAFRDGISYRASPSEARRYFTMACDLGLPQGCSAIGRFSLPVG